MDKPLKMCKPCSRRWWS